jgi:hypothetical protein
VRGSSSDTWFYWIQFNAYSYDGPIAEYDELKTVQITVLPKTICPTAPPAHQNAERRRIFR